MATLRVVLNVCRVRDKGSTDLAECLQIHFVFKFSFEALDLLLVMKKQIELLILFIVLLLYLWKIVSSGSYLVDVMLKIEIWILQSNAPNLCGQMRLVQSIRKSFLTNDE